MFSNDQYKLALALLGALVLISTELPALALEGANGRDSGGAPCPQFEITRLEIDAILKSFDGLFNSRLRSLELNSYTATDSTYKMITSFAGKATLFTIKVRGGRSCSADLVQVIEKTETPLRQAQDSQQGTSLSLFCSYENHACKQENKQVNCYFTCVHPQTHEGVRASCRGSAPEGDGSYRIDYWGTTRPALDACIQQAMAQDPQLDLSWALQN